MQTGHIIRGTVLVTAVLLTGCATDSIDQSVVLSHPDPARFVTQEQARDLAAQYHRQAADIREASRRALMEVGGRKEIAMMVPVVFLVLPVTVLFAIYPGVALMKFSI